MARLIYSRQAVDDLERLTDFLIEEDPKAALQTVGLVEEAVNVLRRHPFIGRAVESDMRELIISRGKSGYIALYSVDPEHDVVMILAIRHQREAGYH